MCAYLTYLATLRIRQMLRTPASDPSPLPCCCLVTACGSAPACGVIRALRQYPPVDSHGLASIRVIGVDCRPANPGRFLVDLFALLPPVADGVKAYMDAALALCKDDKLIPCLATLQTTSSHPAHHLPAAGSPLLARSTNMRGLL